MTGIVRRAVLAAAAFAPAAGARAWPRARFQDVDSFLERLVSGRRVAGAAIRVARRGEVLYRRSLGLADVAHVAPLADDAIYRAYSMTKPVAAAAMLQLAEDGRLDLDAPIAKLVPELAHLSVLRAPGAGLSDVRPAAQPVTVRRLLTHTGGFTNNWSGGPVAARYTELGLIGGAWFRAGGPDGLPDFAARLAQAPLMFEPGREWAYSLAFDLCGLVVERATGRSFGEHLQRRVFEPLGMFDTGFHVLPASAGRLTSVYTRKDGRLVLHEAADGSPFLSPPRAESGASGLVTTLEDYGRFADMIAGGGRRGAAVVLHADSVRQMTTAQVPEAVLGDALVRFSGVGSGASGAGLGFGLGGSVVVDPGAAGTPGRAGDYSWGGAASTTFFASPDLGLSAVLMTQLFPSGQIPLHDGLKAAVFADLGLSAAA
ncbi:serine hydrolase domain-containing protein [Phenylobacterium sp.]|uniref:serine hydrolase domain-containing protein n=1 Tax=Phenylobacterium sp. TaxID=1871053 RepID=UPI00301D02E8